MTCKCLHRWIYFFSLSPVCFDAFNRKKNRKMTADLPVFVMI